jgi:hypothetical protein
MKQCRANVTVLFVTWGVHQVARQGKAGLRNAGPQHSSSTAQQQRKHCEHPHSDTVTAGSERSLCRALQIDKVAHN